MLPRLSDPVLRKLRNPRQAGALGHPTKAAPGAVTVAPVRLEPTQMCIGLTTAPRKLYAAHWPPCRKQFRPLKTGDQRTTNQTDFDRGKCAMLHSCASAWTRRSPLPPG